MIIVNVVVFLTPGLDPFSKVPHRDTERAVPDPKHWQSKYEMKFKTDADKGSSTWKQ